MERDGRGWWRQRHRHSVASKIGWHNRSRQEKSLGLKKAITRRLYTQRKGKKELLQIMYPKKKARAFAFLTHPPEKLDAGGTKYDAKGYWKGKNRKLDIEPNILHEIEFKDTKDDKIGEELTDLLAEYNREQVGEILLYTRTVPLSESSLEPSATSKKKIEKIVDAKP